MNSVNKSYKISSKRYQELVHKYHKIIGFIAATQKNLEEYRKHGDLSENAEYQAEIQRKGLLQEELREISSVLSSAEVIDRNDFYSDGEPQSVSSIQFGVSCDLQDDSGRIVTYAIVGVHEADPENYKISYHTPVAQRLIGKKVGDCVLIGKLQFTIMRIYYI